MYVLNQLSIHLHILEVLGMVVSSPAYWSNHAKIPQSSFSSVPP